MTDPGAPASDDATTAEPPTEALTDAPAETRIEAPAETRIEAPAAVEADDAPEPSWWHRSHPTFAGLMGFFSGVAYVIVVPGIYAALLDLLVSESTATELFPLVLVALVVPLAMLAHHKTRRFAKYMFLGIFSTVVVVAATATLVIWTMVKLDQ